MSYSVGTQIFAPGSRSELVCTFPVATDPVLNVGDFMFLGSANLRVRVTEVAYLVNLTKDPTNSEVPRGDLASRLVYTAAAPLE